MEKSTKMSLMGFSKWILVVIACVLIMASCTATAASEKAEIEPKILCYYTNWSAYRGRIGKFTPKNIDPFLCTHILYSYALFNKEGDVSYADPWVDVDLGGYETFTGLKVTNPKLKALLVIGGTNLGSVTFTYISADDGRRKTFVKNFIKFMRDNNFDGIVLNWNTPATGKGKTEDKENYGLLLREFNEQFVAEASGKSRLELSITITHGNDVIDMGYDLPAINKYVDWVSVRTYDYYIGLEPTVNHPHQLYSLDVTRDDQMNADSTIQYLISKGLDKSKMLFLIATFGRTFTLEDPNSTDLGSPASGPGEKGEFTGTRGFLSTYEICSNLLQNNGSEVWTVVQPKPQAAGPYAYKGDQWVGYDDAPTVALKAEYAARLGLAGLTFWTIDMDDFLGTCKQGPYPLITAAKNAFYKTLGTIPNFMSTSDPALNPPSTLNSQSPQAPHSTSALTQDLTSAPNSHLNPPTELPLTRRRQARQATNTGGSSGKTESRVVCFYTNWSTYRGEGGISPVALDPHLCTHLVYAFGSITNESKVIHSDEVKDIVQDGFANFNGLRIANPQLKTMLSIGGMAEGPATFSYLLDDEERRAKLIQNIVKFLRLHKFDGIDLEWDFPTFGKGSSPKDKENFVKLAEEVREEFDSEINARSPLLFSIGLSAIKNIIDKAYNLSQLSRYVDWMNIRAYDYHSSLHNQTVIGHHSVLFPEVDDDQLTISFSVQYLIESGADPAKLVLGIPTYGRSYTLDDSEYTAIGSDFLGPGEMGPFTRTGGHMAFYEICESQLPKNKSSESWTVVKSEYRGPYAHKGDQWVGYDDVESVARKAKYAAEQGLAGLMFWTVDMDDFRGICGLGKYPLINSGKEVFERIKITMPPRAPVPVSPMSSGAGARSFSPLNNSQVNSAQKGGSDDDELQKNGGRLTPTLHTPLLLVLVLISCRILLSEYFC